MKTSIGLGYKLNYGVTYSSTLEMLRASLTNVIAIRDFDYNRLPAIIVSLS